MIPRCSHKVVSLIINNGTNIVSSVFATVTILTANSSVVGMTGPNASLSILYLDPTCGTQQNRRNIQILRARQNKFISASSSSALKDSSSSSALKDSSSSSALKDSSYSSSSSSFSSLPSVGSSTAKNFSVLHKKIKK